LFQPNKSEHHRRKEREKSKKSKSILDHLIIRQRAESAGSTKSLTKNKREEKERIDKKRISEKI